MKKWMEEMLDVSNSDVMGRGGGGQHKDPESARASRCTTMDFLHERQASPQFSGRRPRCL